MMCTKSSIVFFTRFPRRRSFRGGLVCQSIIVAISELFCSVKVGGLIEVWDSKLINYLWFVVSELS